MSVVARQREPWPATIEARSLRDLRKEVGRAHRNGELAASGPIHALERGGYFVRVLRLKERPRVPVWRKPMLIISGVVVVLGGAAVLGWWLVGVTAPLLLALTPVVVGGLAVQVILRLLLRPSCTITITHERH